MTDNERWLKIATFHDEFAARTRALEFLVENLYGQAFAATPADQHEVIISYFLAQATADFSVGQQPDAAGPKRIVGHIERMLRLALLRDPFGAPVGRA